MKKDYHEILENHKEDMEDVYSLSKEIYDREFSEKFNLQRELLKKLNDKTIPITDADLTSILFDLPLYLFELAEILNKYRLDLEVLKANIKHKKADIIKNSSEKTATAKNEEASIALIDDNLLVSIYSSVITRVENEMSYTRELIMSSKKIYAARQITPPIGEVDGNENISTNSEDLSTDSLPEYKI